MPEQERVGCPGIHDGRAAGIPGLADKPEQEHPKTLPGLRVSRHKMECREGKDESARKEGRKDYKADDGHRKSSKLYLEGGPVPPGTLKLCELRCSERTAPLPLPPTILDGIQSEPTSRETADKLPDPGRTRLVGEGRESNISAPQERGDTFSGYRCIRPGLGSPAERSTDVGKLVKNPEEVALQQEGDASGIPGAGPAGSMPERSPHPPAVGQSHGGFLHPKGGGTRSLELYSLTYQLLTLVDELQIVLSAYYLPGRYNGTADRLSRKRALPEWHLLPEATEEIFRQWGTPEIDLFASAESAVVKTYVSLDCRDRSTAFTDAFSQAWDFNLAWLFPPPSLIPRVLAHLNKCQGQFLLVAPRWERTFWLPDLANRSVEPPMTIRNLERVLIDLTTGNPPP
ncbi:uncharacterized protein LOC123261119 [Cotesia glomerata]|uniref:uncharacterized protein LOC123261119 n=1 Tax=Cotesia glomerata TaxID=32391 RepID=UPI001D01AABF|nr:uncharacterized protein LOC123261119 [Cotesia glomerata]XP_044578555.1 uncharacterized protein LOC123261119 [Cotesia glomerata]XP_044578556.1 uncharacterized protein LOC123261119 [Cotesia glomerata]